MVTLLSASVFIPTCNAIDLLKSIYCIVRKVACTGILLFLYLHNPAQDQRIADSLASIYHANELSDTVKLELLRNLSFNEVNDLKLSLSYAEELIRLSKQANNNLYLHRGYLQKGNKKRLAGDLEQALDAYFKSVDAAMKVHYTIGEGLTYGAIADVYSISGNHANAMLYYHKAINTLRQTTDAVSLASTISNAGDEFLNIKMYDSALLYFAESGSLFEKANYKAGMAYNLGNIGMVYANINKNSLAEKNINQAIAMLEKLKDYYPICVYLLSMCDIYRDKGDEKTALTYANRSLRLAMQYGLKDQVSAANLKLYQLYEKAGDPATALCYFKDHINYRDSVNNITTVQKMADLRTNYEVSRKQTEVDLLNKQKQNQRRLTVASTVALLSTILLAIGLYRRYHFVKKTNALIEQERGRSDHLLLNILPEETAWELKNSGHVKAKRFESVTVMFTDFRNFTVYASQLSPEKLVQTVDFYFSRFDMIIESYGLEKIKTIGDAYMCAAGLPFPTPDHALNMVKAAMEIVAFVAQTRQSATPGDPCFDIRVGVHTGPVVAGVVGIKKFAYDIWGDTVNIAARLESNSETGRINISEHTYDLVKDQIACEYRGEIEAKNRGPLKMYFVC